MNDYGKRRWGSSKRRFGNVRITGLGTDDIRYRDCVSTGILPALKILRQRLCISNQNDTFVK